MKIHYPLALSLCSLLSCAATPQQSSQSYVRIETKTSPPIEYKESIPVIEPAETFPTPQPIKVIPPPPSAEADPEVDADLPSYAFLQMVSTGTTNRFGNPIYKVLLYHNRQLVRELLAVSGRAHTQQKNRDIAGTEAPLPNGRYRVAKHWVPGTIPEVGGKFLAISPMFRTGRSALGFHVDPSYNKDPKEDGTAGCIAFTTVEQRDYLFSFVQRYHPQYLDVQI